MTINLTCPAYRVPRVVWVDLVLRVRTRVAITAPSLQYTTTSKWYKRYTWDKGGERWSNRVPLASHSSRQSLCRFLGPVADPARIAMRATNLQRRAQTDSPERLPRVMHALLHVHACDYALTAARSSWAPLQAAAALVPRLSGCALAGSKRPETSRIANPLPRTECREFPLFRRSCEQQVNR